MSRDPVDWPFLASSIWNMPIGSGATYTTTKINGTLTWPLPSGGSPWMAFKAEPHYLVLSAASPATVIKRNTDWSGNRCVFSAPETNLATVPIPADFVVPDSNGNNGSAILKSDGVSLLEAVPFTRCTASGYATALLVREDADALLTGTGRHAGSHGGSRMTAIGGTLRLGELRPGQQGPRHALSIMVYANEVFHNPPNAAASFRWPSFTSDGYWNTAYGEIYNNSNSDVVMGSLLAIHKDTNIDTLGLETDPGHQLAWTLQNYGGYIVDDGFGPGWWFHCEVSPDGDFRDQFASDYPELDDVWADGDVFEQPYNSNTAWTRDLGRLYQNLWVIDNNSATSVGGGGVPRVDYAPLMETA